MTYPFILPPLPYPPAALEPNLGRSSVRLHHDAFFAAYADRLNGALAPWPQYQDWPLERLLLHWCQLPRALGQAVRRYGGGTYNHTLYFSSLAPARTTKPSPALLAEIEHSFGSMEGLHRSMKNAAASIFGSGWVWLVCCSGGLQIVCTAKSGYAPAPVAPGQHGPVGTCVFAGLRKPAGRLYGGGAGYYRLGRCLSALRGADGYLSSVVKCFIIFVGFFNSVLKNWGYIGISSSSETHTKCSLLLPSMKLSLTGAKASGTFI